MTGRRLLPWLALAAGVAGAAAIVAWSAWGAGGSGDGTVPREPVSATAAVTPRAQLVGDRVVATVAVLVDPGRVDPESVEVDAVFRPYTRVAPVEIERSRVGAARLVRYRYVLQCIDRACVERAAGRRIRFAPATVQDGLGQLTVPWPELTVGARVSRAQVAQPEFRADPTTPAAASFAVEPTLLGWLLAGVATALVLAVAGGGFVVLRRRTAPAPAAPAPAPARDPLAVALARSEQAGDEPELRAALEALASELEQDGHARLAPAARRLAWSRAAPPDREVRSLVESVRRALEEDG